MNKTWVATLSALLLLSFPEACGRLEVKQTGGASVGQAVNTSPAVVEARRPEFLPNDFPLPPDAEITTSRSSEREGKRSAFLVFITKESMDAAGARYTTYFRTRLDSGAAITTDAKSLIIEGRSSDSAQRWSLIGGPLASQPGFVELTVNWTEL